jgi:hypothetical protein
MLSFQYPTWYIIFCAILGAAYAAILYYKDTSFKEQNAWLTRGLAALRWLATTILATLLLSPILKTMTTDIKKPVVVLAQDVSESIGIAIRDTPQYKANFEALANALGDKYEVRSYSFGENVREGASFQFKDKLTNASDLMKSVYDLYSNQNLGALVVATDGIYNEGSNPLYAAAKLNAPVYTIALGDTTPKKDLLIKKVFHNNIAYLGDKFNVQIDVAASNSTGSNTTLNVSKVDEAGNLSSSQSFPIVINKNDFFFTKEVTLDASQPGVQRFRMSVTAVNGESSTVNNVKDIFIEVLDARTKILLLASAPHPDIAALMEAVSTNKNYTITAATINELKSNVADFDFVVLHQTPSVTNGAEAILSALDNKKIPRLYIVGSQTDTRKLSSIQSLMSFNTDGKNATNDVQATLNPSFNLFTLDDYFSKIPNFNPILAPFGDFKEIGGGQVLYYQKIGKVDTKYPLIMLGESNGVKTGIIAAEGLWKWRLFDFAQHQNHDITDALISKIIQYLSVKEDKRKFRAWTDKTVYRENDPVQFGAELYNNSYELINDSDVSMIITNGENKQFNYTFNKSGRSYALNSGILAVGNYSFKAFTNVGGQKLEAEGRFSVQPIQLELFETTADHSVLRALSSQFGGAMVYPKDMVSIADSIKVKQNLKPILYTTNKTQTAMNLKWIFFILLTLLSLEWFARRYFGSY